MQKTEKPHEEDDPTEKAMGKARREVNEDFDPTSLFQGDSEQQSITTLKS